MRHYPRFRVLRAPLSVMMNGFSDSDISSRPRVSRRLTGARSGAFGISCFGIDFRVFVCLQRSCRQSFWNAPQIGPRPLPAGFLSGVPPVFPPFQRSLSSLWPTLRLRALVFWPLSFSISRVLFPQRWTPGLDQEHKFPISVERPYSGDVPHTSSPRRWSRALDLGTA